MSDRKRDGSREKLESLSKEELIELLMERGFFLLRSISDRDLINAKITVERKRGNRFFQAYLDYKLPDHGETPKAFAEYWHHFREREKLFTKYQRSSDRVDRLFDQLSQKVT